MGWKNWKPGEYERVVELRKQGLTRNQIARAVGRTAQSVKHKMRYWHPRHSNIDPMQRIQPSPEALEDRDRRGMPEPISVTAKLAGDPLPGYSALDRYNSDLINNSMRMKISAAMEVDASS